jgi:hypothetical protein
LTKLETATHELLSSGNANTDKYRRLRKLLEEKLNFWDWQDKIPEWKLPSIDKACVKIFRSQTDAIFPEACTNIPQNDGSALSCPYLPAGSAACKHNDCPDCE